MMAKRLKNGNLLIPIRAESSDDKGNRVYGDGMVEIRPDDPDYKHWDEYIRRFENEE